MLFENSDSIDVRDGRIIELELMVVRLATEIKNGKKVTNKEDEVNHSLYLDLADAV